MYLIHARLGPDDARLLPTDAAGAFTSFARPEDGVEHLVVHPDHTSGPVVGLFMAAPSLAAAEERALRLCRRAVAGHAGLRGLTLLGVGAVLVPGPFAEGSDPAPDPWPT